MMNICHAVILASIAVWVLALKVGNTNEADKVVAIKTPTTILSFNPRHINFKKTFLEALSWARLENEVPLSDSFTICSDVTWKDQSSIQAFFTILGQNGSHFLSVGTIYDDNKRMITPLFALKNQLIAGSDGKLAANSSKWCSAEILL